MPSDEIEKTAFGYGWSHKDRDEHASAGVHRVPDGSIAVSMSVMVFCRPDESIRDALANAHRQILEGSERCFHRIAEMSERLASEPEAAP